MPKSLLASFVSLLGCLCAGSTAFIVLYVVLVGLTIPQLPAWAQPGVEAWMLDIPQYSEHIQEDALLGRGPAASTQAADRGWPDHEVNQVPNNPASLPALIGPVPWSGYASPDNAIQGFPLWGPITHPWGGPFDAALIGCTFHDKNYRNHTGFDSPVSVGTPLHATLSGEVVWAGYTRGGWGRLVVIENGDYQIWLAHLSQVDVEVGEIVAAGQIIGLSGGDRTQDPQAGNSSGAHLHYAIKRRTGPDGYVWVDPTRFFDLSQLTPWGCSK